MKNTLRFPHLLDNDLLADLSDDQKANFINQCGVRSFTAKTSVLEQGERADGLFMVCHGAVEISYLSEQGHQSILYHAGAGDVLGLFEALASKPCAATCVAMPNSCVLFCATPLLFQHMQSPVWIRNIAARTLVMLERDNAGKSVDQHYTVEQRICNHLWQLSAQSAEIKQSQSYLATMVGCSRQTVNKELGILRDNEIVMIGKGKITVLSRAALLTRIDELTPATL